MSQPLAYLLSWTTYGTWLHGDARGWVETGEFDIKPPEPEREAADRKRMSGDEVRLNDEQRQIVENTIRGHCGIRKWRLHAVNARTNHVHVVVTTDREPADVMAQFKSWCSHRLSDADGLQPAESKQGRKRWWTEHGSTKWINDEEYLNNAIRYVLERQ